MEAALRGCCGINPDHQEVVAFAGFFFDDLVDRQIRLGIDGVDLERRGFRFRRRVLGRAGERFHSLVRRVGIP